MSKRTVVVGMSGGVDSSVAAALLKEQGHEVVGLFMKNWEEKDEEGVCQSAKEFEDVVRVCDQIGIPHYSANFVEEYWDNVFEEFLDEFRKGHTPNPDILCNREIKFKVLMEKAKELGGDCLATGHYCQTHEGRLLKGADPGKDQSYFLYAINGDTLKDVLFPVGGFLKTDLRDMARDRGLKTAEKKDSTGICFIGKRDFKEFLGKYIQYQPGDFETVDGEVVGRHDGVAFYTIGQRKGMGIGGRGDAWFVIGKDIERNVVIVAQGGRHPALFTDELTATEINWIKDVPRAPFRCTAKVRYRQPDQPCTITNVEGDQLHVVFDQPQRAVTPRQSVVFYDGNICLGGAIIDKAGQTYHAMRKELPNEVSP